MSTQLLTFLMLTLTAAVVVGMFLVMWRERRSAREARVAVVSGIVLAAWATIASVLATRGFFLPPELDGAVPPIGINLIVVFVALAVSLIASSSLRRILTNQQNLIRLNLWRWVGAVFLLLMAGGQVPALWALPAGIGDVIVGASAPWVASRLAAPGGRRRAIIFTLFGMADLIVAIGLGTMTSPGPTQVFRTSPTSELLTHFPLALVPAFLVPLAFTLHVISLWQLLGFTWVRGAGASSATVR